MAQIWLMRHARPLVEAGTCYGRLDVEADPAETRQAATALAASIPSGFQLVCSPLRRCVALSLEVQRLRPELPRHQDGRLAEMDFGAWEGRRWSDLGAPALAEWTDDFANFAPGGGETVNAFMARVALALEAWRGQDAVWITHAGVTRAVSLLATGQREVRSADAWPSQAIGFGTWSVLDWP